MKDGAFSIELHAAGGISSLLVSPGTRMALALSEYSDKTNLSVSEIVRAAITDWIADRKGQRP